MSENAKPCPFCGDPDVELGTSSVPSAITGGQKQSVYCNSCFCEGPTADDDEQAVARWNQRASAGVEAAPAPQPTPYGLAGIEGDAIVIRFTADACAFAFANDPQAHEPRPPVLDKRQFLRDTLNEVTAEREDGSTPLTDMLDRAMVKAMENGSAALDYDADGVTAAAPSVPPSEPT